MESNTDDEPSANEESTDKEAQVIELVGAAAVKAAAASNPLGDKTLRARLFGPLFDEWGERLGNWAKQRRSNAEAIAASTLEIVGPDGEPLQPNMRATAEIIEVGSWSDSAVSQAYLGGLFAGCRSEDGKDDSALPWAKLTNSLSSIEIALHYVTYRAVARQFPDFDLDVESEISWEHNFSGHSISMSTEYLCCLVEGDTSVIQPAVLSLRLAGLIGDAYEVELDDRIVRLSPNHAGAELFARGHARSLTDTRELLQIETKMNPALDRLIESVDQRCAERGPIFRPRVQAKKSSD